MNKIFGYARVSSEDQSLERQVELLIAEGISERDIFQDKKSGRSMEREQYQLMKQVLREGDTVIFCEIDRLGRSMQGVKEELQWFKNKKIFVKILDFPILNGVGLEGELTQAILIEIYSYLSEKERIKIRSRQAQGIEIAKLQGKYKGRRKKKIEGFDEVKKLIDSGEISVLEGCRRLNINSSTYYRRLNEQKD